MKKRNLLFIGVLLASAAALAQLNPLSGIFTNCVSDGAGGLNCDGMVTASSSSDPTSYEAKAACTPQSPPDWTDGWMAPEDDSNCDYAMDGITFDDVSQLTGWSTAGKKNPGGSDIGNCNLASAVWWGNHVHTSPENSDLSNPSGSEASALKYWLIKNSLHEGTTHFTGPPSGHEDLLQARDNFIGGGLFIQDSFFTNADENAFVDIGRAQDGYGNGPGSDFACFTDEGDPVEAGTKYVVYQGLRVGPPITGDTNLKGERYDDPEDGSGSKSYQMFFSDSTTASLGEIWLIDMYYWSGGLGMAWFDNVGKVVVIETDGGGNGGRNGWPGPLKSQYSSGTTTTLTSIKCGGTWDPDYHGVGDGACVGPGMINDTNDDGTADTPMGWNGSTQGDDPSVNGVVPIYFYTSLEDALADGHTEPPLIRKSCTGWSSAPAGCDSTGWGGLQ